MDLWSPPHDAPHLLEWWRPLMLVSRRARPRSLPLADAPRRVPPGRAGQPPGPARHLDLRPPRERRLDLRRRHRADVQVRRHAQRQGRRAVPAVPVRTALWQARLPDVVAPIWFEAPPRTRGGTAGRRRRCRRVPTPPQTQSATAARVSCGAGTSRSSQGEVPACQRAGGGVARRQVRRSCGAAAAPAMSRAGVLGGDVPHRPAWKSSTACTSSARVFITNGPYCATGSPMGRPPRSSTSSSGALLSCVASAASVRWSPAPNTASWPVRTGRPAEPTVPLPAST